MSLESENEKEKEELEGDDEELDELYEGVEKVDGNIKFRLFIDRFLSYILEDIRLKKFIKEDEERLKLFIFGEKENVEDFFIFFKYVDSFCNNICN